MKLNLEQPLSHPPFFSLVTPKQAWGSVCSFLKDFACVLPFFALFLSIYSSSQRGAISPVGCIFFFKSRHCASSMKSFPPSPILSCPVRFSLHPNATRSSSQQGKTNEERGVKVGGTILSTKRSAAVALALLRNSQLEPHRA